MPGGQTHWEAHTLYMETQITGFKSINEQGDGIISTDRNQRLTKYDIFKLNIIKGENYHVVVNPS